MYNTNYKIIVTLDRVNINNIYFRNQLFKIYIPDIRELNDLLAYTIINRIINAQIRLLNFKYRKFK